jgi:hypothetical protein
LDRNTFILEQDISKIIINHFLNKTRAKESTVFVGQTDYESLRINGYLEALANKKGVPIGTP